jgi:hypothetical protein
MPSLNIPISYYWHFVNIYADNESTSNGDSISKTCDSTLSSSELSFLTTNDDSCRRSMSDLA